jgi:hypothetical protein
VASHSAGATSSKATVAAKTRTTVRDGSLEVCADASTNDMSLPAAPINGPLSKAWTPFKAVMAAPSRLATPTAARGAVAAGGGKFMGDWSWRRFDRWHDLWGDFGGCRQRRSPEVRRSQQRRGSHFNFSVIYGAPCTTARGWVREQRGEGASQPLTASLKLWRWLCAPNTDVAVSAGYRLKVC